MHHGVRIQDTAIIAAATLSHRYIADRFLPDKAIDLIDEAASGLRIEIDSMPTEIDTVERRIQQLEIEHQALKKEKDEASVARREAIERELADLRERSSEMKAHWQGEKDGHRGHPQRQGAARAGAPRGRARRARRRSPARRRAALRRDPRARAAGEGPGGAPARAPVGHHLPEGGGGRRGRRQGGRPLDRDPRVASDGGRGREADPHGGPPARARGRPGRGGRGRVQRAAALARRAPGPGPADRHVPIHRTHGRRQDRARPRARGVHVRLRAGDGPHRHVGVHGEALRLATRGRAARLRRLRRGRPADRGRAPAPLLGRAARRDREGPRGRASTSCSS